MGQCQLLATSIRDLIPDDRIVNLVVAVVNTIDLKEIEERYVGTPGNPAYPRRMLLRLLVQAAFRRVYSPQKRLQGSVMRISSICIWQGMINQIIERSAGVDYSVT